MSDLVPYDAQELRDYRIEVRVKNARILGMMRRAGIDTVSELCRRMGKPTSMTGVGEFINLKRCPISKTGKYVPLVQCMADALFCDPDDLFTEQQRHSFMATNRHFVEVSEAEVELHLERLHGEAVTPEQILDDRERLSGIKALLEAANLTTRQYTIIKHRFGLDGNEPETLRQVAERFGIGNERVRQIEIMALRRLSHKKNVKHVMPWLSRETKSRYARSNADVEGS